MTIEPETLAAFADNELTPIEAARVARQIAGDPALMAQVTAHRALRARLAGHYAPTAEQAVPERLTALLKDGENVVSLIDARAARAGRFRVPAWALGGAIAASLVVGLGIGTRLPGEGPIASRDGVLVASGAVDRALSTQLASAQGDAPIRILVSFREKGGAVCRGFDGEGVAGIACRGERGWAIRRIDTQDAQSTATYRQAGSAAPDILGVAQNMADGTAMDSAQEQAARAAGWR